jgi:hypothetical protein
VLVQRQLATLVTTRRDDPHAGLASPLQTSQRADLDSGRGGPPTPLGILLIAERAALLSGRDDEFVAVVC